MKTPVESIQKTPYLGLYEVLTKEKLFYTDEKVNYLFTGEIIEAKTRQNVTRERLNKLATITFSDLPLDQAVKTVRGNGKHVIATFEDPNCGYCKKLAKELHGVDNVTIYTFLFPILAKDSEEKTKAIWCSADRSKAWLDWMLNGVVPKAENCDVPIEKFLALGDKFKVVGTPTLFLANGERLAGALSSAKIEEVLLKASSQ